MVCCISQTQSFEMFSQRSVSGTQVEDLGFGSPVYHIDVLFFCGSKQGFCTLQPDFSLHRRRIVASLNC